eukprot:CAMPEP_0174238940 /NCGR_PEP_ID=MMETSP0417-20130205/13014_1 /TAXON_ID=242541 /ORGANISM="Mayorella sp, Strain BSH-02190019" /LENGTH=91 /DNA_ID=CAMNT_0015317831 /DNA_START=457 /DNA_END=732 /DNA_ORIENTATION=-
MQHAAGRCRVANAGGHVEEVSHGSGLDARLVEGRILRAQKETGHLGDGEQLGLASTFDESARRITAWLVLYGTGSICVANALPLVDLLTVR